MAYFTKQEAYDSARKAKLSTETYSKKLESIVESQKYQYRFDVFLSHSVKDAELVLGVVRILEDMGQKVYVDWVVDKQLSRDSVTKETAETLRNRMKQSSKLLYLATNNASSSKWMPWELGYFDGLKSGKVAILPLVDYSFSSFKGQEYLGLYPALDKDGLERFLD